MSGVVIKRLLAAMVPALALCAPASAAPPAPVGLASGWTVSVAGGTARPTTVPSVVAPQPLEATFGGTRATYRTTFIGPETPDAFGWGLRFEQVRRVAKVTLNGIVLGASRDPYVPFTLSAPSLRPGAPNELVVEVDNRKAREPREGWWNWGGITRPVTLVPLGPIAIRAPAVLPQVRCAGPDQCTAHVLVDAWVTNRTAAPVRPVVELALAPPGDDGPRTTAGRSLAPLAAGQERRVRFSVPVRGDARLWSPDRPDRYAATLTARVGGNVAQVDRQSVGLRSVAVKGGRVLLNGRRVELRGASIQEDVPGRGPALTDGDMDDIVSDLQAVGANVTRAHYLLNDRLLDRLDAAGILVWSQAPVYHRDVLLRTPRQREIALASVRGTVLAARRHPSVITHSVANELSPVPDTAAAAGTFLRSAARVVRDLDPTLPVSVDVLSYPNTPYQRTYRAFDLLGINTYFGWYKGKPGPRSTARLADLAPFLRSMRRRYPDKGLVMTEFGAEATEQGPAAQKQTFAFQADYLRRTLEIVNRSDAIDGAIYWTLREFAVKPKWDGGAQRGDIRTDAIHNKGLITYAGQRKPAFAVARELFADTALYVAPQARGRIPPGGGGGGGDGVPGGLLVSGILAALCGLVAFDAWCFAGIRAERREAGGEVVALRGAGRGRLTA